MAERSEERDFDMKQFRSVPRPASIIESSGQTSGRSTVGQVTSMAFDNLDAVAADADGKLDRSQQQWMFDRLDWFRLTEKYTPKGDVTVIKAEHDSAQAWLFLAKSGYFATLMTNWLCLRSGIVYSGNPDKPLLTDELAGELRRSDIHHIYLEPLGDGSDLVRSLKRKGWAPLRSEVNLSWRIDCRDMDFDAYWAERPSRLRNTAKRKARKANLTFVFVDHFDQEIWTELESVFAASWKLPDGTPELTRKFAQIESDAGTLRLGLAYKDGQPIAAQFWTIENGIATIHKLAYREDSKQLSAGTILSVEMFRRALDIEKVDMIDFGYGNDRYKAEWMTYHVPLYAITAYDMLHFSGLWGLTKAALRRIVSRMGLDRKNAR